MWRAGSPEGYQPPVFASHEDFSANDSSGTWPKLHQPSCAALQNVVPSRVQNKRRSTVDADAEIHSVQQAHSHDSDNSTRPGTPPTTSAHHHASRYLNHSYQPLLDPLLPVSDVQPCPSPTHQPNQTRPHRSPSFRAAPSADAHPRAASHTLTHAQHAQHAQHDHSAVSSEHSLPGLQIPLEAHERQLLNNLLRRSHSTGSQDRSSDHSHSSASTYHDGQMPLSRLHSLPRSFSDRRLSPNSMLLHDKSMLHEPSDLSRCGILFQALL